MTWETRIINDSELALYLTDKGSTGLAARVSALLAQQQATWPMLQAATAGLARVEYKHFTAHDTPVIAQYNPRRIVSTSAKVDAASIKARPCFLCADNLPAEEKGIAFGADYVILCNPFPVLRNHLVISHREHTPQTLDAHVAALLELTRDIGATYFTLYNGPKCGASAPDHMHFQACERSLLPLVADLARHERRIVAADSAVEIFTLTDYRLNLLALRGRDQDRLAEWLARAVATLAEVTGATDEPLLNLTAWVDEEDLTVCLFPRSRHRPACYFAEGEAKFTISPAGIDLAGVLVVPEAEHFARLTADVVAQIYAEVTLADERFEQWLKRLADG